MAGLFSLGWFVFQTELLVVGHAAVFEQWTFEHSGHLAVGQSGSSTSTTITIKSIHLKNLEKDLK